MVLDKQITETPIEDLKKRLYIKKIKDKEYYYKKIKFELNLGKYKYKKIKEIYISPKKIDDEKFRENLCLAQKKTFSELFNLMNELSKKHYISKYLTDKERKVLEILRFGYQVLLKQFEESDLKRYEEAIFTKYVYGTTSIEGNTYTLRETNLTLNEGITIGGKDKREFYEIDNYRKLKKEIKKIKSIKISLKLIKLIHKIIMQNIDDDSAGITRKINVGIRGTEFVPVPGILVDEELEKLIKWFEKNESDIHPIELVSKFHQKFEEIHPFKDGNGRVGRELVRLILEKNGFPTIFIDKKNREEYLKCLDKGNRGSLKELTKFFFNNLINVHETLIKNAKENLEKNNHNKNNACKDCSNKKKCDQLKLM